MRGHEENDERVWLIAIAPGAFLVAAEGFAWMMGAIFSSTKPAQLGIPAFGIAILAGVLAPAWIALTRRQNAWMWVVISLCVTLLCLGVGFFLWFFAALVNCNGECLG